MSTTVPQTTAYTPTRHVRIVTATSIFDGHDASINIMRRIFQASGAEVIHLGHNRSVKDIVSAAIQEDADAVAVSSYQGGHMEFFKFMVDLLREEGASHIKVFCGGGGTIVPREIRELEAYGVARVYSPEDGRKLGLQGMINDILREIDRPKNTKAVLDHIENLCASNPLVVAQFITAVEEADPQDREEILGQLRIPLEGRRDRRAPVLGVTGTGGAGKSSLVDELITRFLNDFEDKTIAVLSVDPSRRKTGGALLGDRIRMNSLGRDRVYMRSLATRATGSELSGALADGIEVAQAAGFDLIIVETAGIGQGDAAIVPLVDAALYVMTAEFGAQSQLEKIDMLDYADLVAINKFDRKGAEDALRDVRKQYQRNNQRFDEAADAMPVYGTIASRFNDDGVTALYHGILDTLAGKTGRDWLGESRLERPATRQSTAKSIVIPPERERYLAEIAETVRAYKSWVEEQGGIADRVWQLEGALEEFEHDAASGQIAAKIDDVGKRLAPKCWELLEGFKRVQDDYAKEDFVYTVREREFHVPLSRESLAGTRIPKISLPKFRNTGELLRWLLLENIPGAFPFTAGVFPFRREDEQPTRMFAGEGDAQRTNERFKLLSKDSEAKRLSTAFDSVTLYGSDPSERLDVYGKVGTSGVSICTLDDMKTLFDGFDLCAASTSVSMTINGPAPMILAMFLNAAIDQQVDCFAAEHGREPTAEEFARIKADALCAVRGTVQADILKEDQAQNTCIFAIDFALRMMADIQKYFIDHEVRNFYSVSISGYHMAEAGANPITQAAFTLANGFTFLEYYRSLGMAVDDFVPSFSFFYSNGMDPEYAVLNRASRRIWAVALRDLYGANERSQKFKLHVQTSGRSLHAQEISFNDIRTTLQALTALYDNCNSLHTNAYDEAITTPTDESVRRALAIQMIIHREYGLYKNENMLQGSFIIEELTDLVEEAILSEFESLSERGGVLGAMERGYQRGRIQDESHSYESLKNSGAYPIIGVNTFVNAESDVEAELDALELRRGTEEEKQNQLKRLADFKRRHQQEAPAALKGLQESALSGGNVFESLMDAVRVCSMGQITQALFEVGGQYRRNT
ncbi:MAG: methylmalonyl-CoA mutase family protein [Candidatus Hydrogenedentes bacterium]|nr:methylmalonyl-CoA mutase family protein [Candidatus Hydrogenedentota bacterium]